MSGNVGLLTSHAVSTTSHSRKFKGPRLQDSTEATRRLLVLAATAESSENLASGSSMSTTFGSDTTRTVVVEMALRPVLVSDVDGRKSNRTKHDGWNTNVDPATSVTEAPTVSTLLSDWPLGSLTPPMTTGCCCVDDACA